MGKALFEKAIVYRVTISSISLLNKKWKLDLSIKQYIKFVMHHYTFISFIK